MLLVVALLALSMWRGVIPSPFSRPFTMPDPEDGPVATTPCPLPGSTPAPFGEITANVYNSTTVGGLAGEAAGSLTDLGVVVSQTANYSGGVYEGTAEIVAGPRGITAAYTVALLVPESTVTLDRLRTDETIDVVLGSTFDIVVSPESDEIDLEAELAGPADCVPVPEPVGIEDGDEDEATPEEDGDAPEDDQEDSEG